MMLTDREWLRFVTFSLLAGTEIHAVAKTEDEPDEEEGGLFAGVRNYLGR